MTSWKYLTFLILSVSLIDLSMGNCQDYYNLTVDRKFFSPENLMKTFNVTETEGGKFMMCSVSNYEELADTIGDCWSDEQKKNFNATRDCVKKGVKEVPFYHFVCLVAISAGLEQNATTTAAPSTTTALSTTTAPSTTKTKTTALSTSSATMSTSTKPQTTQYQVTIKPVMQSYRTNAQPSALTSSDDPPDAGKHSGEPPAPISLCAVLVVSLILNIVLPGAVYLYMNIQRAKERKEWIITLRPCQRQDEAQYGSLLHPQDCDNISSNASVTENPKQDETVH
ncbi:uncharacterized protein KZ484_003484 isoform 2-T2 [Pholidichthys leucotaenia]